MKITIGKANALFATIRKINVKEFKSDKTSLLFLRLYPLHKELADLDAEIQKDIEEIKKPLVEELNALKPEEREAKQPDIDRRFGEAVDALPSVKSRPDLFNKEVEVELPLLTADEYSKLAQNTGFSTIGETEILLDLVEK